MDEIIAKLSSFSIVPVVVLDKADDAEPLADALYNGGLPCAEVTFRTVCAKDAIKIMLNKYPDMMVGAGTVLTIDQVKDAIGSGAKFIVTPGFDPEIVDYCLENDIPIFPGVITPSELAQAYKRNLKVVKFFPAEQFGGVKTIEALSAPYTNVKFMPTGGINLQNLENYLNCPKIAAVGGSWMVAKKYINAGQFGEIENMTREAVKKAKIIRG